MRKIYYCNPISEVGTSLLTSEYEKTESLAEADAVLVRSASLNETELPDRLLAIARAGAGVNNIPIERCTKAGVVVFNTPGANANGVKELAICGMLLACRDIVGGVNWVQTVKDAGDVAKTVEKGKKAFAGTEIKGKKLGVIGLGAIGGPLANAAVSLGMEVYGCDPFLSVDAAWRLDSHIKHVKTREEIFAECDIITVHTPLVDDTRHMINESTLSLMKDGVILLNFARDALVDDDAMETALKSGKVRRYVTDFPNDKTAGMEGVIAIPHLGASTEEAEDNCAAMAVRVLRDFIENGNIRNSVNYPSCDMGICTKAGRITILHENIPNMISRFTAALSDEGINISDMINRSKDNFSYTMLDTDSPVTPAIVEKICQTEGVIRVRAVHGMLE